MNYSHFDINLLYEYFPESSYIIGFLEMFEDSVKKERESLKEALRIRNQTKIRENAHKLKSTFKYIGAPEAAEIYHTMERLSNETPVMYMAIEQLEQIAVSEYNDVMNELLHLKAELQKELAAGN